MCKLAAFPPGFPQEEARRLMFRQSVGNKDGCGVAYVSGGKFVVHKYAEPLEDGRHEIVGQGAFLGGVAHEHADDHAHVVLDLDNEDFLVIADEDRATTVRRQNAANLDRYDVALHG